MSNFMVMCTAAACGGLRMLMYSYYHVTPYDWRIAIAWTLMLFAPFQIVWNLYLYPFYFSPYLSLPQGPRKLSLKTFFTRVNGDEVLEWMDNVPNDGVIRYIGHFNKEFITPTDPRGIADIFGVTKSELWGKDPSYNRILRASLGDGLFTAEEAAHKYQRKYLLPAFHTRVVKDLHPLFWSKASELVSVIKRNLKANSTDIIKFDNYSGRAALDIIGQAGFGADFDSLAHPDTLLNKTYSTAYDSGPDSQLHFSLCLLTHPKLLAMIPLGKGRRMNNGVKAITAFVREGIRKRMREMAAHKDDEKYEQMSEFDQKNIIAKAMKSGAFDEEGLVNQSTVVLGAGHETSSTGLCWAIHLLSLPSHRAIQSRLRDEVRALLPPPSSDVHFTAEMLEQLPYLDAVSKELLRFRSPVGQITRVAKSTTTVIDVEVEKGTPATCFIWAINQAKHLWGEDARVFRPERWLVDEGDAGRSEGLSYMTFGHGARSCIGRGFAIAENKTLLAALIGSFEFSAIDGEGDGPKIFWGITVKFVNGLKVQARVVEGW